MSRIDKSNVESIVIDWFRNAMSKEKSRWFGVRVVSKVNDDLGRKRRTKKFSFNQIANWRSGQIVLK